MGDIHNCDEGVLLIQAQCDYTVHPAWVLAMVLWSVWAVATIMVQISWTMQYSTNDFRFFIACEAYRGTWLNRIMCLFALTLTVCNVMACFVIMGNNGDKITTTFFLSISIFFCINVAALNNLLRRDYDIDLTKFPVEVPVVPVKKEDKGIKNLWGGLVSSNGVIMKLENVLVCKMLGGGTKEEQDMGQFGDESSIMQAFRALGARKDKVGEGFLEA